MSRQRSPDQPFAYHWFISSQIISTPLYKMEIHFFGYPGLGIVLVTSMHWLIVLLFLSLCASAAQGAEYKFSFALGDDVGMSG